MSASFDEAALDITVEMALCADADNKTKYRVHFDHTVPFAPDPDRNGDGYITEDDFCVTTSDDTMMHRGNKDTGPGLIRVEGSVLKYTVHIAELNPQLDTGDTILVWADTQYKGIKDRAPDTNDSDGCGKPEVAAEYIELVLAPPTGCAAGDRWEDQGDGTVLDCNTDLVWLKDANCAALPGTDNIATANWDDANAAAAALSSGTCGLTDGSQAGDWRLPTISEWCNAWVGISIFQCPTSAAEDSLINTKFVGPAVSNAAGTAQWSEGDAFVGVVSATHWSATEAGAGSIWVAVTYRGFNSRLPKSWVLYVWPVRDGQ